MLLALKNAVHPLSDPTKITQVSEESLNSQTESCLFDPWPTFFIKEFCDILLPLIQK